MTVGHVEVVELHVEVYWFDCFPVADLLEAGGVESYPIAFGCHSGAVAGGADFEVGAQAEADEVESFGCPLVNACSSAVRCYESERDLVQAAMLRNEGSAAARCCESERDTCCERA